MFLVNIIRFKYNLKCFSIERKTFICGVIAIYSVLIDLVVRDYISVINE
jgi:hypothetical protein